MWRGERRGIDNGPAVQQRGGGMYVCVSECVCETQGGEGMVRSSGGDIAGSREARHCVVQLWEAVGVYSVCVCAH